MLTTQLGFSHPQPTRPPTRNPPAELKSQARARAPSREAPGNRKATSPPAATPSRAAGKRRDSRGV